MYRVYIDEAGDRGHRRGSSEHFVLSAVLVNDASDALARAQLGKLKTTLGRKATQVLHFRKLTHSQKVKASQEIASMPVAAVTNVIICKRTLAGQLPDGGTAVIKQADPMYLYAMRLLLERVSWYVDEHGGGPAIVTVAHLVRFPSAKLHNYRSALNAVATQIRWSAFAGHPFRVSHPNAVDLLQLADIAASALFKAVEADEFGNREKRYLSELSPLLYRRGAASMTSYGLKVFPSRHGQPGGSLDFLRGF